MSTVTLPDASYVVSLSDDELLAGQRQIAESRRQVDAAAAAFAGEIARRSAPEFGSDGLARRQGLRTPDKLVSYLSGTSGSEARDMVRVGEVIGGEAVWLAPVAAAVTAGELSVGAAAAIRAGLGEPTADIAADDLHDAAKRLARDGRFLSPEKMAQEARFARDQLDVEHVQDREAVLRAKRGWWMKRLPNGLSQSTIIHPPEEAALLWEIRDGLVARELAVSGSSTRQSRPVQKRSLPTTARPSNSHTTASCRCSMLVSTSMMAPCSGRVRRRSA